MADPKLTREESRASNASLIEVEPSPVDETPIDYTDSSYFPDKEADDRPSTPFLSQSGTLVGLGNHGPAFYREMPMLILIFTTNTSNSYTHPTLLLLRLHHLRRIPHCQYINHTTDNTLRPIRGLVPPPHSALLPIPPL